MSRWSLFGLNPKFKEFVEKYPDKTMLGLWWAFNWRAMILVLALELVFLILFVVLAILFASH